MPKGVYPRPSRPPAATCSIEGCGHQAWTRGWCNKHYQRWRLTGNAGYERPAAERFWLKVDKDGPLPKARPDLGNCWDWTGSKGQAKGRDYGRFSIKNCPVSAHRWAYESEKGPIPAGLEIDHLCVRPCCVRPSHLEAVTHLVNIQRALARISN